jgi:MarR family transcriptional regulator, transcriptional regulator for hemolysin
MAQTVATIQSELGLLIIRLGRIWRRETDLVLAGHALSQATALPLRILSRRGGKGIRQGVLAEEAGIEGPSLVRLIDLLQAEGLVERREDPTDRRAKLLHLTAAGEAKADEIDRLLRRVRVALLKDIPAEDLAVTFETLLAIEARANGQRDTAMAEAES